MLHRSWQGGEISLAGKVPLPALTLSYDPQAYNRYNYLLTKKKKNKIQALTLCRQANLRMGFILFGFFMTVFVL